MTDKGHVCVAALVGKSKFRKLPEFFIQYFDRKITEFDSPNFIRDSENKSIKILRSFIYNLLRVGQYFRSIRMINKTVKKLQPDLIISFYEPLTGLYRFLYKRHIPCISIAHQFGWKYTGYISGGSFAEVLAMRFLTSITSYGSDKLFCIYPKEKDEIPEEKIVFIPPLIRKEIKNAIVTNNGSITCYLLNSGYIDEVIKWHNSHPEQVIQCFADNWANKTSAGSTLFFYEIDDTNFIEAIRSCRALISTAGYELICEAIYLGKPVLMVPVKNHFEQHLNSIFFEHIGAGLSSHFFDLNKLLNFTGIYKPVIGLKDWTEKGPAIIEKHINELLNRKSDK